MSDNRIRDQILDGIIHKAESIIEDRAKTLISLIEYEISIVNMEQAINKKRGTGYEFLSKDYASKIHIGTSSYDGQAVSLKLSMPSNAFAESHPNEIECFKEYVLANAITRLKNM